MNKILSLSLMLFLSFAALAQQVDYNQPLPANKQVKRGKLSNGMTYYIYSTDVVKDRASYYIIQNVGSILENDNQQGLAHFLEHMAFNGTEHFEGKGVLNTLQKHGAIFGKDINAYTSFDETVYNLNNIPTKDGLVDTCLLVLHDWSNYLLLTEEEIDAERGVIAEERRTRESGGLRLLTKALPTVTNGSKYASRLPIGDMDIVANFKYKALRDFYHDWYRTDLQAIAIIGDIDVEEIEKKIQERFTHIPAVKNPRERFTVQVEENDKLLFHMGMDEEVSTSRIEFAIRHKESFTDQTVNDLKESLLKGMTTGMINDRLKEIQQKPDAPFLYTGVSFGGSYAKTANNFSVTVVPKPNMQKEAFQLAMNEVNRALKFGFVQGEIERKVKSYVTFYENQLKKLNDKSHSTIANEIKSEYLSNEVMTDLHGVYALVQGIFAEATPKDFHQVFQSMYTQKNRTLNLTGVEGNKNMTEADVLAVIQSAENNTSLTAYEENFDGATLMGNTKVVPGKIASVKEIKEIEGTTFELSNGVKVHYKFADKQKNEVRLSAISYGGESLVSDADYPSLGLMGNLIGMSGLGDYNANDLKKVLAGKSVNSSASVGGITEGVNGVSSTNDVETLLQYVHLQFVAPRFDEQSYQVLQNMIAQYIVRRAASVDEKIKDRTTEAIYGKNHPREAIFNQAYIDKMSFEQMKKVYQERFKDAADFEFFIVGDVKADVLKPLLEKYIASIPSGNTKEKYEDKTSQWVKPLIKEKIPMEMENPKGTVNVRFKKEMEYSLKNSYLASILGDIMDLRYTESLREEEGGTYGAGVRGSMSKRPKGVAEFMVRFDCNPVLADKLVSIVHKEIEKIIAGDIKDEDLQKTLTNYLKERKEGKDKNSYDMRLLKNFVREGYNMNESKNFEGIINNITKKDIQKFAKKLFKNAQSYEIVFVPAEAK